MELHGLAAAAAVAATAAAARLARRVGNTRDAGAASRIWVTCGVAWDVLARHGMAVMACHRWHLWTTVTDPTTGSQEQ
jgi:hypothetical protein